MIFHINVLLEVANLLRFSSGHQPHILNQEIQSNQKFQNQASSSRCLKFENISNQALNYFSSATHHPFNLQPEKLFKGYPVKSTQVFIGCHLR
jgi:hypothetical protein